MPRDTPFRILNRDSKPFAVAYQRGSRFVLWCPAWRASAGLAVNSLEDLGAEHFPSGDGSYQWGELNICPIDVRSAGELFEYALNPGQQIQVGEQRPAVEPRRIDPQFYAEPVHLPSPLGHIRPWAAPYRRGFGNVSEVVINLEVLDLGSRFRPASPEIVRFVVDTGADVTIVRRSALRSAFRDRARGPRRTISLNGKSMIADYYQAGISIPQRGPAVPFSFGGIEIAVVDSLESSADGVLGRDALGWVIMISDRDHVFFTPPEWLAAEPGVHPTSAALSF